MDESLLMQPVYKNAGPDHHTGKLLLTPEEAAQRLGCGRTYVFHLIKSGALESVKVGRLRRVPAAATDEFVARLRAREAV